MKKTILVLFTLLSFTFCKTEKNKNDENNIKEKEQNILAKIEEQSFTILNDSLIFKSATIENFDKNGNSLDVYWIGKEKDTILRFYRKYDNNMKLTGAEYYEAGDIEPSKDTVFLTQKV